jgi:shikimate dehydrogenase
MKPHVFGVLGDPIAHSKSPVMHNAAYAAFGLPHTYERIRAGADDLPRLVHLLREGRYDGLNVTVPHKRNILAHVDAIDPSAALVGAANTLVRRNDGRIIAHNTDVPALAEELCQLAPDVPRGERWQGARALVLGTGATARSAVMALACDLAVAHVVVRGRSFADEGKREAFRAEMGERLAAAGAAAKVHLEPWLASGATERSLTAIVQATSAGMDGADPGEAVVQAVEWSALSEAAVALDVVYAPAVTPFLRAAASRRLRAGNGFGMLARQGAIAFELWLGIPAPFEAMRAALAAPG